MFNTSMAKMAKSQNLIWVDKSADYLPWFISGIFVALGILSLFDRREIIFLLLTFFFAAIIIIHHYIISSSKRPLKVLQNGIIISEDKRFFPKKVFLPFKSMRSMAITRDKKNGTLMEFIEIVDSNNKSYRNVIMEVSKFKEALKKTSLKIKMDDSGSYRWLPKKLR